MAENPLTKQTRRKKVAPKSDSKDLITPQEQPSKVLTNVPTDLIDASNLIQPTIDKPLEHLRNIIGANTAANFSIQEQSTVTKDSVQNTRTLTLEIPARKRLPEMSYQVMAVMLVAIIAFAVTLVLIF